jgi:hypothetical protein
MQENVLSGVFLNEFHCISGMAVELHKYRFIRVTSFDINKCPVALKTEGNEEEDPESGMWQSRSIRNIRVVIPLKICHLDWQPQILHELPPTRNCLS